MSGVQDSIPHLHRQIQSFSALFQLFHHAHTLPVMGEPSAAELVQSTLPRVAKGRMAQIVSQGNGLCQILIEAQGLRYRPGILGNLKRMSQPRPVVVSSGRQKYLSLMLQTPE